MPNKPRKPTGYCDCPCRDCFDISMTNSDGEPSLCSDCEEAGCNETGDSECCRDDAYGCDTVDGTDEE
jgi:hypothetical protein